MSCRLTFRKVKKRIVIVEDDPDILQLLQLVFEDDGFETVLNSTGLHPDDIAALRPDVVLLDIRISGAPYPGDELCRMLKASQDTSSLPVILLSAERNLPALAICAGADAYIDKPFDLERLLTTARMLANR